MVRSDFLQGLVCRGESGLLLSDLLETALGVYPGLVLDDILDVDDIQDVIRDEIGRDIVALVEIDRADRRLDGVGQDDRAGTAGVLGFAAREEHVFIQADALGDLGQGNRVHDGRAISSQLPFRLCGVFLVQECGHDQLEDRVAQEFQALVMLEPRAAVLIEVRAMRARGAQQGHVRKRDSDMFSERFEVDCGHGFKIYDLRSKSAIILKSYILNHKSIFVPPMRAWSRPW